MESNYEAHMRQNPEAQADREHRDQLIERESEIENQLVSIRKEKELPKDSTYEEIDADLALEYRQIMEELYPEGYLKE